MSGRYDYGKMPAASAGGEVKAIKAIGFLVFVGFMALLFIFTLFGGFFTVGERERAVVTRMGAFSYVAGPGFHLKMPFLDSVIEYNVSMQSLTFDDAETFTVDNQPVKVDFVVNFEIPDGNVARIYREVPDYAARLRTMAIDRMKIELGKYNISDLPVRRGQIAAEVLTRVRDEAERLYGLRVIDVQLLNLEYSQAYQRAVDQAAVAKANVEQAEQLRRQAEVQAQTQTLQARAAAEIQEINARGAAAARLAQANAEAQAIRVQGQAQADAIRAQSTALAESPNYVALEQARRWNGTLPTQILGTAPVPFLNIQGR